MSFLEKLKNKKIKIVVGITVVSSLLIGVYYLHNKKSNTINSEENYVETYTIADNEKIFIESISLNKLPYTNLFDFYKVMNDKIYIFEKSLEFGEYKDINNKEELRLNKEISEKIEKLEVDLKKTISKLKRENQFAKKMELNVKATQLQKEIDELKNSL